MESGCESDMLGIVIMEGMSYWWWQDPGCDHGSKCWGRGDDKITGGKEIKELRNQVIEKITGVNKEILKN